MHELGIRPCLDELPGEGVVHHGLLDDTDRSRQILTHQPGMTGTKDRLTHMPQRGVLDTQCPLEPGHVHASK